MNSKWPKLMLMGAATAAWLVYDMASATEVPRQGVAVMQYGLLAAALIGLVGILVARAVFQLAVLAPKQAGAFGDDNTTRLCVIAAVAALLATGLAHLLLVSTPSPLSYFGWIVGLLTVAAVVVPFLGTGSLPVRFAEAAIHLVIGMAIGGLVSNAAASASRLALQDPR